MTHSDMPGTEVVDVLCIGSGSAGLAAGAASAGAGLEVLVAEPSCDVTTTMRSVTAPEESWTTLLQRRWGMKDFHGSTTEYLEQLTSSLGPPVPEEVSGHLPIDTVETFEDLDIDPKEAVPPFHGAELATWAQECLMSPFGMMFSRPSSPSTLTPMRKADGTSIAAGLIASVPTTRRREVTVRQWLSEVARENGATVHESCSVQQLLFYAGQLVGALLDTPEGPRSVRARRGVLLGTSAAARDDTLAMSPMAAGGNTTLCVVGRTASRFARLEFLRSAASNRGARPCTVFTAQEGRLA